jgi:hypothetical protein
MLIVDYCRDGIAVSDFDWEYWLNKILEEKGYWTTTDMKYRFSTEVMFHALRLEVAKGTISPDDILFRDDGQDIHINEYGAIQDWPRGFLEENMELSEKILTLAMAKRKIERLQKENGK